MNLQGLAGDKRRDALVGDCFEYCGHRFTGGPGLKEVHISFPSGCFSSERKSSSAADSPLEHLKLAYQQTRRESKRTTYSGGRCA
jgi:hypothetical protein